MNGDHETWIDCLRWRERWDETKRLPGGGQGDAFRVRHKTDGRIAFLKSIRLKSDPERRARFSREANAYDTFRVSGVPAFIESNAHRHTDVRFEPYIATEFIDGPTLRTWRESTTQVALEVAVEATRVLLSTLRACHGKSCVHRDVKPDNVILAGGNPSQPVLLDFGLSYHETPEISFATEHSQEIGNRFLRLPELSAGSSLKQDVRSDLSFAAGILFYMLTGKHPDLLQDAEGRFPHQRSAALASLQQVAGLRIQRLASFFDNAFAPRLEHRFSSADAMLASIDKLMAEPTKGRSAEDDLRAILEVVDTEADRRRKQTVTRLSEALRQVERVHQEIQGAFGGALGLARSGHGVTAELGRYTLSWRKPGSSEDVVSTRCESLEAGDEIIIRMSDETVFRTSIDSPDYGEEFRETIRRWVLARIRTATNDPDGLPPEAVYFAEHRPLATLDRALEEARRTGRSVLAFVYDPAQPDRGKLKYCLMYFLENRKTRDALSTAFVLALLPLSQFSGKSNALDGLSMETSRWLVLDEEARVKEQAVIYANPQEGERIALDLTKRLSSV